MGWVCTLLDVGELALVVVLGVVPAPDFFFLILIPGTGAEFRASRNPVHSIAAVRTQESGEHHTPPSCLSLTCVSNEAVGLNIRCAGMIFTLISLAELEGVFRGLYFFSSGGASAGPELVEERGHKRKHSTTVIGQQGAVPSQRCESSTGRCCITRDTEGSVP